MERVLLVGVGGFPVAVLRYVLGGWIGRLKAGWPFPLETLLIHVAGGLALGALAALAESRGVFSGTTRAFLFVGLLGGFTTFSSYGDETFELLRDGQWGAAGWSTGLQVVLGTSAVWAGHSLVRMAAWARDDPRERLPPGHRPRRERPARGQAAPRTAPAQGPRGRAGRRVERWSAPSLVRAPRAPAGIELPTIAHAPNSVLPADSSVRRIPGATFTRSHPLHSQDLAKALRRGGAAVRISRSTRVVRGGSADHSDPLRVRAVLWVHDVGAEVEMKRSNHTNTLAALGVLAALVPFALGGCAATGINQGQVNVISSDEEVALGQQLSVEVAKQFPIYHDAAVEAYVQAVGDRIVQSSDRKDIAYHFAVISKNEMNAFSLPGGYIYLYTELMRTALDEAEFAAVVAHEIGHVTARHSTERLTQQYGYQLISGLVLGQDPNTSTRIISDLVATGGFLKYSRDAEFEADLLGARYLYAAGYDPRAVVDVLERLRALETSTPSKFETWLMTHPGASDRLARVRAQVAAFPQRANSVRNAAAYAQIKARLPNLIGSRRDAQTGGSSRSAVR